MAWIIASLCIVLVIGAFLWPMAGSEEKGKTASRQKPVVEEPSIETIIATAQTKEERHQIKRQAEPVQPVQPARAPAPEKAAPVAVEKAVPAVKAVAQSTKVSATLPAGYYVQLGAFKERQRAEALTKRLSANWVTHIKAKPNNMRAVWAGPYPSSKEAERIKAEIAARTKIKGFIVKN